MHMAVTIVFKFGTIGRKILWQRFIKNALGRRGVPCTQRACKRFAKWLGEICRISGMKPEPGMSVIVASDVDEVLGERRGGGLRFLQPGYVLACRFSLTLFYYHLQHLSTKTCN
jgi:hypothetical protein